MVGEGSTKFDNYKNETSGSNMAFSYKTFISVLYNVFLCINFCLI